MKYMGVLYSKWPHRTHKVNKKNSSTLDCNLAEKFTKNGQNQAVWFGWVILQCFLQISQPHCNLESWSFFCSLCVFCAVILNTINSHFSTICFWVSPLALGLRLNLYSLDIRIKSIVILYLFTSLYHLTEIPRKSFPACFKWKLRTSFVTFLLFQIQMGLCLKLYNLDVLVYFTFSED